jgi:hypothetical protein
MRLVTLVLAVILAASGAHAATLSVGPGQVFVKPSQALAVAVAGDTIEVAAGTYVNDPICIKQNGITLKSVGGMAVFESQIPVGGKYPPTNAACSGKGIAVIAGSDVTVDGFGFTGMKVSSSNGAGIRAEGTNLTIRNSLFSKNEMGILANDNANSTITIEDSEFSEMRGGPSIDQGHNIYIGAIKKLIVNNISSHHAHVGHQLKTRARENQITNSRFYDGEDGDSSFAVDISGGVAVLSGNYFQKGPRSENPNNMLHFYTSRDPVGPHSITITGNTFEALLPTNGYWLRVQNDATTLPAINGSMTGNTFRAKYAATIGPNGGVYPTHYNYKPVPDLTGVLNTVIDASGNTTLFVDAPMPIPGSSPAPQPAPVPAPTPTPEPAPIPAPVPVPEPTPAPAPLPADGVALIRADISALSAKLDKPEPIPVPPKYDEAKVNALLDAIASYATSSVPVRVRNAANAVRVP